MRKMMEKIEKLLALVTSSCVKPGPTGPGISQDPTAPETTTPIWPKTFLPSDSIFM